MYCQNKFETISDNKQINEMRNKIQIEEECEEAELLEKIQNGEDVLFEINKLKEEREERKKAMLMPYGIEIEYKKMKIKKVNRKKNEIQKKLMLDKLRQLKLEREQATLFDKLRSEMKLLDDISFELNEAKKDGHKYAQTLFQIPQEQNKDDKMQVSQFDLDQPHKEVEKQNKYILTMYQTPKEQNTIVPL